MLRALGRHLRLSWISRSPRTFAVSIGFALVGVSSLVWVGKAPFTIGFWLAHALDIGGVLMLTIAAIIAYRQRRPLQDVIGPLVANEPLSAFALGLDPVVHQFVASLEEKDPITRDHVVRTASMAMRVAEELHTVSGEQLIATSRVLARVGPIVRGHHERIDGGGYPDGLCGSAIPLAARIVSVCDAFDAMANTGQYRTGMGPERAKAILREHAGSQWDPVVVAALVSIVDRGEVTSSALDNVGRSSNVNPTPSCGCEDALPPELLLTTH